MNKKLLNLFLFLTMLTYNAVSQTDWGLQYADRSTLGLRGSELSTGMQSIFSNIEGAPTQLSANLVAAAHQTTLGITADVFEMGLFKKQEIKAIYAYTWQLNAQWQASAMAGGGMQQQHWSYSQARWLVPATGNYREDLRIGELVTVAGARVYSDYLYWGLYSEQLPLNNHLQLLQTTLAYHYSTIIEIQPIISVKIQDVALDFSNFSADHHLETLAGLTLQYKPILINAMYSTNKQLLAGLGVRFDRFFWLYRHHFNQNQAGFFVHEFSLNYNLSWKPAYAN